MSCNWCHETTPPNRKDGFCSDSCEIQWLRAENERLTDQAMGVDVWYKLPQAKLLKKQRRERK